MVDALQQLHYDANVRCAAARGKAVLRNCLHPLLPKRWGMAFAGLCPSYPCHPCHPCHCSRVFAGAGGPWEFNLRDLLRWCELAESAVPLWQQQPEAGSGAAGQAGEAAALDAAVQHYASLLFLQRLRTAADRKHAASVFADAWGAAQHEWLASQGPCPELHITPTALKVGWACLARASSAAAAAGGCAAALDGGSGAVASQLALLPSQLPVLESLAECATRGWMCLLVGPAAGGKTAAVRSLAALAGQPLLELSLTSGTDTSDLLGGFEQVEPARKVQELGREAQALLAAAAELLLVAADPAQAAAQLQQLGSAWQACTAAAGLDAAAAASGAHVSVVTTAEAQHAQHVAAVAAMQQVLAQLSQMLASLAHALDGSPAHQQQRQRVEEGVAAAAAHAAELSASLAGGAESVAGKFEWVDGALTR